MTVIKVLIGEINGQELDVPTEYELNLSGNYSFHRINEPKSVSNGQHMLTCQVEITAIGSLEIEPDAGMVVLL
jgi:hypothetical protein